MVEYLLDGVSQPGTELLVPPFVPEGGIEADHVPIEVLGGARGDDGTVAVVLATWSEQDPGALSLLRVGPDGAVVVPLGGNVPGRGEVVSVAVVGGTAVVWTCSIEVRVFVVAADATGGVEVGAPGPYCYQGLREVDGQLMGAFMPAADYDVRTWSVSPSGLTEVAAESLPANGTNWTLAVGRRGADPYVIATNGFGVTYIDPAVVNVQDANDPMLVRDGQDWFVIHGSYGYDGPTGPDQMHRWSPVAGTWEARGTSGSLPTELRRVEGAGVFGVERVQWGVDERVTVVTEASWHAPVEGTYAAQPLSHGPCDNPEDCARIGEWWPAWVVDRADDRRVVWILWSWFGPAALVSAPL